jgi:general secretion pathway protein D
MRENKVFDGKYDFFLFKKPFLFKALLGFLLLLHGCATSSPDDPSSSDDLSEKLAKAIATPDQPATPSSPMAAPTVDALQVSPQANEPQTTIIPGTGDFVNSQPPQPIPQGSTVRDDGEVTLNFEAAAISEVAKVIFDILEENYVIDPRVRAEVTVQTGRPLPKELLIPTLESLLRMNNAVLVYSDGIYKIVPATGALPGNAAPVLDTESLTPGYGVRIVPLRYIGAQEMAKILEPLLPRGGVLYVDSSRNLLMLGGASRELNIAQQTVDVFDVNWLKGMSIGMYRLQNVDSGAMVADLSSLFGEGAEMPGAGLFRFLPISQINAVLVITPQAEYLEDIGAWIERLDSIGGERLYVYEVQNGNAEYIASILAEVFGTQGGQAVSTTSGRVAPGLEPAQLSSPGASDQNGIDDDEPTETGTSSGLRGQNEGESRLQRDAEGGNIQAQQATLGAPPPASRGTGNSGGGMEGVRIIPDVENNTLLIWASNFTYEKILDALRKLDLTPRQVLVEVTIAEVTLGGDLQYGLQWFFKNNVAGDYGGRGVLGQEGTGGISRTLGGASSFAYSISKDGVVRLLLEALAEESRVKILSSPQIMVIDNQEAEIRVGNDQPVRSSTTTTDGGNITESIEFRQTGVVLTVSPQVNAGGLITMDIAQEVTDVGDIDAATGQRSFLTREVQSRVAIQSGETIVLGGLISESRRSVESGIPVLYKVPVIGPLFGRTTNETNRTELLVLITPQVARDNREALQVTEELKQRMRTVAPFVEEHFEKKPIIIEPTRS